MPLPADQQLEQDMISQAASDAAWHQIASQPSKAPTSDASPMSGRGTWKSGCGGQQGSWQLHQLPPTPRSVPMVSPGPQGQCQGGCGGCGGCGPGGPAGPAGPGWGGQPQWLQPPSETQDQPNWMPHFLGAEAVREYDTWRTQRPEFSSWHAQEMRPMLLGDQSEEAFHVSFNLIYIGIGHAWATLNLVSLVGERSQDMKL